MKRKLSMIITSLGLALTFSTYAIAASFPDVDEAKWGWAKSMIEELSNRGIVAGYEDQTFRPGQGVTKIECLLLIARIMGVNDKSNAEYVALAEKAYADTLKSYSTSYKKEVSYLLYKDVLSADELSTYIGDANAATIAKRYEAAILLTKAMGAEKEVKSKIMTVLSFSDAASIPVQAKPYVEYVRNQNIMQGVSATEFGPMIDVNRAMMAVMLYKVMQKNQDQKIEGSIVNIEESQNSITINESGNSQKSYKLADDTVLRMDGVPAGLSSFAQDVKVRLTFKGDLLTFVEGITPIKTELVEGVVAEIVKVGTKKIAVNKDGNYSSGVRECIIDDNVQVSFNGSSSTLNAINKYDSVKVTIQNNKAVKIVAESRNTEVTGKVVRVDTDDSVIKLKVKYENDDTEELVVADDVSVKRNGKRSDLKSIVNGDTVTITLEYNKVKSLEATSDRRTTKGTIEAITISKEPTITVKEEDGTVEIYSLKWDMEIKIDSLQSQIYDLRLGYQAELLLDSNTVTSLDAKKVAEVKQITGRVELVNESYYMINISVLGTDNSSSTQQIFVKKDAKIIHTASSSNKTYEIDDIKQGDTITAVGSSGTGVFEANTIIIIQSN